MSQPIPELSTRQLILGTLVVLGVGLAFWLLYRFNRVVILFFVAIVLATATRRLVRSLEARGLSRRVAALVVYGVLLAMVVAFVLLLLPLVVEQSAELMRMMSNTYENARQSMLQHSNSFIWRIGFELPEELYLTLGNSQPEGDDVIGLLAAIEQLVDNLVRFVFTVIVVFLLSFYWVMEGQRVKHTLLLALPYEKRQVVSAFVDEAETKIGAFVGGQAILSLVVGVMALVAYLLIGLPYAGLLAIVAGILEAVPLIGPVLAIVPAVIVAISQDPVKAIWVLLAMALIQQVENGLLVPRIMHRSVGIHPVVTLLSLMAFSILFGVAGALAAVPLAALIQLLIDRYLIIGEAAEPTPPEGRDRISRLQYQAREFIADAHQMALGEDGSVALANGRYLEEELEDIASELALLLVEDNGEWLPEEEL